MWRKLVQSTYRRKSRFYRYLEEDMVGVTLQPEQQWAMFVGALALEWTHIRELLDIWVEAIHKHGGAERIQAHLPANLDRALDYLSEALKCGLVSEKMREDGKRLISEIHHLKNFRHNLIHGRTKVERGRVICENRRARGAALLAITTTYTVAQQFRHYDRTRKLVGDLRDFLVAENEVQSSR